MVVHHNATFPPCPRCGSPLMRVRRHLVDRLLSLVRPVRRYRCHKPECLWEGRLRAPPRLP